MCTACDSGNFAGEDGNPKSPFLSNNFMINEFGIYTASDGGRVHNNLELVKNGQDLLFFYVDGESVILGVCECLDEQCVPCEGPGKVFEADSET